MSHPVASYRGVSVWFVWVLISWAGLQYAGDAATPELKTHTEVATASRHEYTIELGGTMDGCNTRSPIGYQTWTQEFEPNISVKMENVGSVDVVNPWVFVNGKRNWRTVEDIVAEATAGRESDKEKAIGIWQFETNHRFHWTTGDNEDMDPVKVFNIYGYTLCGNDAHVISDLWRTAGLKVRRGFPQGHCVAEVFYDGRFHLLDGDENIICLLRDNETIACEADVVRDHDLMKRTHTYGILRTDSRFTDEFSAALYVYERHREGEHRSHIGHTMHFTLRPGEALEWRWDNDGKYHSNWTDYSIKKNVLARICNGRMSYTPELPELSKQNGTTWKIHSPYVMVGGKIKGKFIRPAEGDTCQLMLSFDEKKWKEVASADVGRADKEIDLEKELSCSGPARYMYYVKLESSPNAGVEGLSFETDLQMAPLSLPALEVGENKIVYVDETKEPYKLRITHTWRESSTSRPPEAPPRPLLPEDGASVEGTKFVFKWKEPADPDGDKIADYHFQLSARPDMLWHLSPNFNKLISHTEDKGKAQYTVPYKGLLNPGQAYYWRVRARDEKGVWSKWSNTWRFTPQGPGVPLKVRCARANRDERTITLTWSPNPQGRAPVGYRIYGSDEKGFTVSDQPYEVLYRKIQKQEKVQAGFKQEMKTRPANFACETTDTKITVVGPSLEFPNANKAYYRVVAVDEKEIESGPSDYAAVQRPFIYSLPSSQATVGRKWAYQIKSISSIGDLRCRTFVPAKYLYNAAFWDKDTVRFHAVGAPAWLKIDEASGLLAGVPGDKDVGEHCFMVYADIPKVACDSQTIELEVKPR